MQRLPKGGRQYATPNGQTVLTNSRNRVVEFRGNGLVARYAPNGQARFVQTSRNGVTTLVTRGSGRQRTIETIHPNGVRVVSYGPHFGFTERPVAGSPGLVSRTLVRGDSTQVAIYRTYSYQNRTYYRFIPSLYYRPEFYAWINAPWSMAMSFDWGPPIWGTYYGAYFTPYPVYSNADLWLTDYILNANLQQAYAEQQADYGNPAGYSSGANADQYQPYPSSASPSSYEAGQTELDPDVKTLITQQIHAQIAQLQTVSATVSDNAGIPSGLSEDTVPESLKPGVAEFMVSTDMQLDINDDQSCALTPGDVLFRKTSTPDKDGKVQVIVVGTKGGDCEKNSTAAVSVATLEEINNQFEQQEQSAQEVLAAKSGKGQLPAAPTTTTTKLLLASSQQPDQNADSMLQQNQIAGQQAETELANATTSGH